MRGMVVVMKLSNKNNNMKTYLLKYPLIVCVLFGLVMLDSPTMAQTSPPTAPDDKTDSTVTPDQARQWLKEKLEAFGGDTLTDDASSLKATITYKNVSFEGDILSLTVAIVNSNGNSRSFNEKLNIAAIRQGSFKYLADDRSWDKGTTYDPVVVYKIQWSSAGTESPVSTETNESFYSIKIKDEAIAKRVVNALNFLSAQVKPQPF
jgi:hypothetical protein